MRQTDAGPLLLTQKSGQEIKEIHMATSEKQNHGNTFANNQGATLCAGGRRRSGHLQIGLLRQSLVPQFYIIIIVVVVPIVVIVVCIIVIVFYPLLLTIISSLTLWSSVVLDKYNFLQIY